MKIWSTAVMMWSSTLLRTLPARIPRGMDSTTVNKNEIRVSAAVTGSLSASICPTGML